MEQGFDLGGANISRPGNFISLNLSRLKIALFPKARMRISENSARNAPQTSGMMIFRRFFPPSSREICSMKVSQAIGFGVGDVEGLVLAAG